MLLLLAAPIAAQAQSNPCADAAHHAFDFWIGRWTVTDTKTGRPAGQSLIESLYGGCTIRENWTDPGLSGGSLNTYDATTGKWRQTWTDSSGAWREFVGGMQDGKMMLVWRFASVRNRGQFNQVRLTFTPNPDGSVRQYSDTSRDDGASWAFRYDYTYRRVN
ncbi:MAG: hypothetical protein ACXU8S_13390 [Phenylobacterium sp.]